MSTSSRQVIIQSICMLIQQLLWLNYLLRVLLLVLTYDYEIFRVSSHKISSLKAKDTNLISHEYSRPATENVSRQETEPGTAKFSSGYTLEKTLFSASRITFFSLCWYFAHHRRAGFYNQTILRTTRRYCHHQHFNSLCVHRFYLLFY